MLIGKDLFPHLEEEQWNIFKKSIITLIEKYKYPIRYKNRKKEIIEKYPKEVIEALDIYFEVYEEK